MADNAVMALYFLVLIALPAIPAVRRIFRRSPGAAIRPASGVAAEDYWRGRPVSVLQLAMSLALAFLIATIAVKVSGQFREGAHPLVRSSLGQKYLVLTVLSIAFPLVFPRAAERLAGSDELGTFLIYVFFVLVGVPASFEFVLARLPSSSSSARSSSSGTSSSPSWAGSCSATSWRSACSPRSSRPAAP